MGTLLDQSVVEECNAWQLWIGGAFQKRGRAVLVLGFQLGEQQSDARVWLLVTWLTGHASPCFWQLCDLAARSAATAALPDLHRCCVGL